MIGEIFKKFYYYVFLGIKKPRLILNFIYKKHLGLIFIIPIKKIEGNYNTTPMEDSVKIIKSKNVNEITNFYKRMNRDSINNEIVKKWLSQDHDCFLVYSNDEVIGGNWIFKRKITLNNISGKTLSAKSSITINDDCVYSGYIIIDPAYRGRGIYQSLQNFVINYYAEIEKYKNILFITGASNGAMIRSAFKSNGKLIGITEVRNFIGFIRRKELFLDKKEKVWI